MDFKDKRAQSSPPEPVPDADGGRFSKVGKTSDSEIIIDGVCKAFGDHVVLRDISVKINSGELLVVVGESGCGKTVLLDIVTGMIEADAGRVLVADHDQPGAPLINFSELSEDDRAGIRRHWGEVFQRNALYGGTVRDNISLWFNENSSLSQAAIDERIRHSLAAVNLDVDDVIDKPRRSLSGGMAKRVAIARAIAIEPIVMFYDEPTSGLDPMTAARIHELIWQTHSEKSPQGTPRTTVIVSHDRDLLRRLGPRVLMLHEAGVLFDGKYDDFEGSNDPVVHRYLGTMPRLNASSPSSRDRRQ